MGPRLFSRGMLRLGRLVAVGVQASMGPRLFSRGMVQTAVREGD